MMDLIIRKEEKPDYRIVEELTREAFWNLYLPGCDEHFLVHQIRKSPDFIPELDFVALKNDEIVGNILFSHSYIIDKLDAIHPTITFGPVSVLPEFQNQGIGSALIRYAMKEALALGHFAIIIYGYPEYYKRFGFKSSKEFMITDPDGNYPLAMLAVELLEGSLKGISGKCCLSDDFTMNPEKVDEFDRLFPYKEKQITESQKKFEMASTTFL